MELMGLTSDRFVDQDVEFFTCIICSDVVINPKMCDTCNHIFCGACIDEWLKTNKYCPFRCSDDRKEMEFMPMPKSIKNMYGNLKVRCSKEGCGAIVPLKDLFKHENSCGAVKCSNHGMCGKDGHLLIGDKRVSSEKCYIYQKLKNGEKIPDNLLYQLIQNFAERASTENRRIRTFHCFWNEKKVCGSSGCGMKGGAETVVGGAAGEIDAPYQLTGEIDDPYGLVIDSKKSAAMNTATKKCFKSAVGAYVT